MTFEIQTKERMSSITRTIITDCALFPTNFEKQSVSLVTQVMNEETVAALSQDGRPESVEFVDNILSMWKILNNRNVTAHIHLNDSYRKFISSHSDPQLTHLKNMSKMFSKMVSESAEAPRKRMIALTPETRESLVQTLEVIIKLCPCILKDSSVHYIVVGNLLSDTLEGEFSIYRGMFCGLYHNLSSKSLLPRSSECFPSYKYLKPIWMRTSILLPAAMKKFQTTSWT